MLILRQIIINYLVVCVSAIAVEIVNTNRVKAENLNPNPNPLVIPTSPEQVEIKNLVPITLEQAIALGLLNNRQLQITRLELEASRANLEAAEAALFPTLGVQGNVRRTLDAGGDLAVEAQRELLNQGIQQGLDGLGVEEITDEELQLIIDNNNNEIATVQQNITLIQEQLQQPINPSDPTQVALRSELVAQLVTQSQQLQQLQSNQQQLNQFVDSQDQLDDLQNFATTTINGTLSLQYAIFSPGRQANIDVASQQVRISELQINLQEQQLRLDVSIAYYDLQQADQEVRIAQRDVEDRSKRLEGIELLLEAALATKVDLLNAQVELDNSRQNLNDAVAQQETARRRIAQLLSLPPDITPVAQDEIRLLPEWKLSLQDSIILAFKNRVELEQQLARTRQFEGQREIALASVRPQLRLFAQYDLLQLYTDAPDTEGNIQARGFADGYSFGVEFNWNFFDGGAAAARARQEETNILISEQQYADIAQQIRFQVEQAFFQLPSQTENVKIARIGLERAQEAVRAAEVRYQANVTTQTEVLDAQTRLVRAQNNLLRAVLGYNRAIAQLQRAVSLTSLENVEN